MVFDANLPQPDNNATAKAAFEQRTIWSIKLNEGANRCKLIFLANDSNWQLSHLEKRL
jgi:hypothetical protein